MKLRKFIILVVSLYIILPFISTHLRGEENNPVGLVSTSWLQENLKNEDLIILHYGKKEEFDKGHIPGSRLISLKDIIITDKEGIQHELPDNESLQAVLRKWGINQDSRLVLSYSSEHAGAWMTRLYFTLDYCGLGENTSILNGGLIEWISEKRELSTTSPEYNEGNFVIQINESILARKEWIASNIENKDVVIIDARPPESFSGTQKSENVAVYGHIKWAKNIPSYNMMDEKKPFIFKNREELADLFLQHSIRRDSIVVSYCNTGVWATQIYFAAKILGYKAKFYDGSFQEWSRDETLPVIGPVKRTE